MPDTGNFLDRGGGGGAGRCGLVSLSREMADSRDTTAKLLSWGLFFGPSFLKAGLRKICQA